MSAIEKKRREKGLTQAQLAEIFGLKQTAVSKWETGASLPSGLMLIKLSRFFGCTIDDLLSDDVDLVEAAASEIQVGP